MAPAEGKGRGQQVGLYEEMEWGLSVLLRYLVDPLVMVLRRKQNNRESKSFCCIANIER